ncbi:response regulator [Pseudanabaena sp. Chao 1811]|uniref:response regulator n=1 Tax=Pseudanabaena sp. Chao 1811 TaxID=2963092 RepID=UPI0022F3A792|nr:response regulator [Pseudanabaena sp. Chao 1811]
MVMPNFQVLIVDDNEINRDMLARRLHRKDFNLSMASDGRAALSMVQVNRYDLILLDIMMPEVDGYAVLRYLKQDPSLRNIPVIIISALEEMDSVMQCMEIGADDYLTKPFDPEMLKSAINRCLPSRIQNPPHNLGSKTTDLSTFVPVDVGEQITAFNLPEDTTRGKSTNSITLDEVVLRIMQSGIINRKSYLYFSKAIYNNLFENVGLSEQEVYQIRSVFDAIQSGRIRVIDANYPSKL